MKRIICTVSNDLTYDQRMIRICTSMAEAGYEVTLIGRELPTSKPLTNQPFAQQRIKLRYNKGKFFYLELNLRLLFWLLFSKFNIVYAVDLDTLLPARLVAFLRSKTCIFDAHEYFTEVPELAERPMSKKVWEIAARLAIPGLKYAITVGECLAEVFERRYGVHFMVLRNVPLLRKQPTEIERPDSPFILIYQGVLNDGRGLEEAILAMKQLDNAVLWLCGEGDLSGELRLLVEINGLKTQVKFFGKVSPNELAQLTEQAHLGLNLLKNKGLNYYYSLANKAFDYIQSGIPSLGMNFPEYARLNKEYEVFYLLDVLEPGQIASAVLQLRSDKSHYERLATNCHTAAKELNWENESQKLLEFIHAIR